MDYLTADFETTTVDKNQFENLEEYRERVKDKIPEVYSWALCRRIERDEYKIKDGIDLEGFLQEILSLENDTTVFFHNGAKFDLHYLVMYLKEQGFKQNLMIQDDLSDLNEFNPEDYKDVINILEKPRPLEYGEYSMVVDGTHKIMELKLALPSDKRSNKRKKTRKKAKIVRFRDTNLMFPSKLSEYGETLNEEYDTDKYSKMDLNSGYTKEEVYKDYEEFLNDGNEREYLHQDVKILSEYIFMIDKTLPLKKWKMTAAGTAYSIWKYEFYGEQILQQCIEKKTVNAITINEETNFQLYYVQGYNKAMNKRKAIDILVGKDFPLDWMSEFTLDLMKNNYEYVHEWYQGGLTMANPKLAGLKQKNIAYIDINSSYPTQMRNMKFPKGKILDHELYSSNDPNELDESDIYLSLYEVEIGRVENKKGLPFVPTYSEVKGGKHYPLVIEDEIVKLTDKELKRFKQYYKGDYEVEYKGCFSTITGEELFGGFIDYFYELKANASSQSEKVYAKLMLNSLYGKFGQDIARDSKVFIGEDVLWETLSTIAAPKYFLPLAVWITAYARMYMVDAVGDKFENVNYLDTDSLSIICKGVDLNNDEELKDHLESNYNVTIDKTILGGWDIEDRLEWQIARRAKQYFQKGINGEKKLKFAGLNLDKKEEQNLKIEDFILGKQGIGQIRPFRTPYGIIIENYEKQILPIWEYNLNPSYWFQNEAEYKEIWKLTYQEGE